MEYGSWIDIGSGGLGYFPLQALQRFDPNAVSHIDEETKEKDTSDDERRIHCKSCGSVVTTRGNKIVINGSHEHSFKNPSGILFRIGCFFHIMGCYIMGTPTMEFTWFPGYAWCYVICSECMTHLGWNYQSGDSSFYGLILANLAED